MRLRTLQMELTEGNLHSTLEYHSDDEIGKLAHSMRKSIRILGTYVDDIDRSMKLFQKEILMFILRWSGEVILSVF